MTFRPWRFVGTDTVRPLERNDIGHAVDPRHQINPRFRGGGAQCSTCCPASYPTIWHVGIERTSPLLNDPAFRAPYGHSHEGYEARLLFTASSRLSRHWVAPPRCIAA